MFGLLVHHLPKLGTLGLLSRTGFDRIDRKAEELMVSALHFCQVVSVSMCHRDPITGCTPEIFNSPEDAMVNHKDMEMYNKRPFCINAICLGLMS